MNSHTFGHGISIHYILEGVVIIVLRRDLARIHGCEDIILRRFLDIDAARVLDVAFVICIHGIYVPI